MDSKVVIINVLVATNGDFNTLLTGSHIALRAMMYYNFFLSTVWLGVNGLTDR